MIKAILFDMDNTLFPEEEYFRSIFERFASNHSMSLNEFDFLFNDFNEIRFGEKDIFKYVMATWAALKRESMPSGLLSEYREELFGYFCSLESVLLPYDGVQNWINTAIGKNITIGVLTNGLIDPQSNKWRCLNLEHKEKIVFMPARRLGADKPHPLTFKAALSMLNVTSAECLFVGDRYNNDLAFGVENGGYGILIGAEGKETAFSETVFQASTTMYAFEVFMSRMAGKITSVN